MNNMNTFILLSALLGLLSLSLILRPWQLRRATVSHGGVRSSRTALALALLIPLAVGGIYAGLGNPAGLQSGDGDGLQGAHRTGAADIERMVQGLAQKLEKNPDDPKGWIMLARSWKVMGRYGEAEQAFARAGKMVGRDADLLAEYADVVAMRDGGRLAGKASDLVNRALALDPNHLTALWMAGTAAYQRKDYSSARRNWERVLKKLPADSADRKVILANLDEIRILRGEAPGLVRAESPKLVQVASKTDTPTDNPASARLAIGGTVRLAPSLASKVSLDDAVFVFARPATGSRMPLAVLRARVSDLPMDFVLDSSNAMSREHTLERAGVVVVEARISKHGDAKSQPGDLIGMRAGVEVGAKGVAILIDQVL